MSRQTVKSSKALSKFSELGAGKLTMLVFGMLTVIVVYSAYHIIPFYYGYFEIQNQMQSLCEAASVYTDKELRQKLKYHLRKQNIPVSIEEVKMNRGGRTYSMSMSYEQVFEVYIPWKDEYYEVYVFEFDAYAEADI